MEIAPASEDIEAWDAVTNGSRPDASRLGAWVAVEGADPAGGLDVRERPDGHAFLSFFGSDPVAQRLLVDTARRSLGIPLHAVCRDDDRSRHELLVELGFETVLTEDVFRVDFREAMAALDRAWVPAHHSIVPASSVEPRRLFELDNRLRRLVPGTEDWQGDFDMFTDELSEAPPYDDAGYLVGVDDRSGELLGLIRFWRNRSGPRLGLVAVTPSRRGTTLGPALLAQGLGAASRWGSTHFVTETAQANRHVHRRLVRLGAEITGSLEILRG